jgi:hypothetical protein
MDTGGRRMSKKAVSGIMLVLVLISVSSCITHDKLVVPVIFNNSSAESIGISGDKGSADVGGCPDKNSSLGILEEYEADYSQFRRIEIGDRMVFWSQRKMGDAIVEKDFVVYQFDKNTGELLAKKTHWRDDLKEYSLQVTVGKEQAESVVDGEVQFSKLYIISPESDVFPIEPMPANPCWVVRSIDNCHLVVTIIDAIDGDILGYGIPPPYAAFSLSGPWYFDPCNGTWDAWYKNAEFWFNEMGYPTEAVVWPTEEKIKSHIQSNETALFYEIAHSGGRSDQFKSECLNGTEPEYTYAYEIEEWIANYTKMPFAFLASCFSMCNTSDGTLSHEFRKGSTRNTVTIGYCNMSGEQCHLCWIYSLEWQNALFNYMNQSHTVKYAFDQANVDYPMCVDCMRFVGDENLKTVPKVKRVPVRVHDVAVVDVTPSKSVIGQRYCVDIAVAVENQGDFTESFNVSVFYDETAIILPDGKNYTTTILTSENSTTLTIPWNTTDIPKGNYTIKAHITPHPEETNMTDNTLTDGWIVVTILGDVDGDFDVDIYDIVSMCVVYDTEKGDPNYAPNCDIDCDGDVDIYDIVTACVNYEERDP